MDTSKKRLTLDIDASLQRRLKSVAALKGVSMRKYCQAAIEQALERDEQQPVSRIPFGPEAVSRMDALREAVWQGRKASGDSTEILRQMREERSAQLG